MKLTPRHYQRDACVATREQYEAGLNRLLTRMATGCGKTSGYAVNLLDYFPDHVETRWNAAGKMEGGVLFLSHRIEIIRQAYATFDDAYPERWIALEQGPHEASGTEDFVFMSVDSGGRDISDRIHKYEDRKFGMVIVDEGHHPTQGGTWDNVLNYFGVGSDEQMHYGLHGGREKPLSVLMTATPERNDGRPLTPFVDGIAYDYKIRDAIRDGWLTDIRAYRAFEENGVWESMGEEEQVDFLIRTWQEYAAGENTLCFAGSVDQSDLLARTLNAEGIARAGHVDAETEEEIRTGLVEGFRSGEIEFLSNRFVFTEGFDNPLIMCILDNGPTESEPRHIQKVGRGLRPHPEAKVDSYDTAEERRRAIKRSPKPFLTYISTFDPTTHGLDVVASILGTDTDFDAEGHLLVEEVVDVLEEGEEENEERPAKDVSSMSELKVALEEVDVWDRTIENEKLKARTHLRWVQRSDTEAALWLPENPHVQKPDDKTEAMIHVEAHPEGDGVIVRHIRAGGWVQELGRASKAAVVGEGQFDDLSQAISRIDRWLYTQHEDLYGKLVRGGSAQEATEQQKRYMTNQKIAYGDGVKEGTADILIDDFKITRKLDQTGLLK